MSFVGGRPEEQSLLNRMEKVNRKDVSDAHLLVERPALTVEERQKRCLYQPIEPLGFSERIARSARRACHCSRERFLRILYLRLPILEWLIGYDVKNWLLGDVVAGVTIAIMHIPQGMGFALLAHVPAICGIYMAFYQSLIYAFLATSRHNSMGSFAVITLMTGKVVKELATFPSDSPFAAHHGTNETNSTQDILSMVENATQAAPFMEDGIYTPIQIATVVTFMVGVWHMVFGLLQLGSLAVFLSDMLVSGFTTAAAVHVLTSQMKDMLGISIMGFSGPLKIIYTYIEIVKAVPTINILTLIITIVTISVLMINNEVLKPIVAKYSKVPIPIELIAVVVGTAASYFANLEDEYSVNIIGNVPTGLPPPTTPPLELLGKVCVDSFVIAVVSYTVNFSLAKIFAAKHGYSVDATQELYATGVGNIFSSFFSCPPTASALARALVQDAVGGKTQMVSLIVCVIIILVLLFIGPVFETLPKAVLASIIVVALKGMFMQVKDMVAMWRVSKVESITWLITFFSVVIIDIDFGLLIGIVFSLFVLLAKNQSPSTFTLGRVPNTDLYLDMSVYSQAKEVPRIRMFRIVGAIHFANREGLKATIVKGTGLDPKQLASADKKKTQDERDKEKVMMSVIENGSFGVDREQNMIEYLVVDVSGVSYVDSSGGKFLEQLRKEYEKAAITLCIAGLSENVLEIMERSGCLKEFPSEHLFHSLHDATTILTTQSHRF